MRFRSHPTSPYNIHTLQKNMKKQKTSLQRNYALDLVLSSPNADDKKSKERKKVALPPPRTPFEAYQQKLLEFGYLPSPHRFSPDVIRERYRTEIWNTWNDLRDHPDTATYKKLCKIEATEAKLVAEGVPMQWGNISRRLAVAQRVRTEMLRNLNKIDFVIQRTKKQLQVQNGEALLSDLILEGLDLGHSKPPSPSAPQPSEFCLLTSLPNELLIEVCSWISDPRQLSALFSTCHTIQPLCFDALLWKRLFADLYDLEPYSKQLEEVLSTAPLVRIFGAHDGQVMRELYLRAWFSENTSFCGLCRSKKQAQRRWGVSSSLPKEGWHYPVPTYSYSKRYKNWHQRLVESACMHCKNLWLLTEPMLMRVGLCGDITVSRLMYRPAGDDDSPLYCRRVFLEDSLASTIEECNMQFPVDFDKHALWLQLLPRVFIKRRQRAGLSKTGGTEVVRAKVSPEGFPAWCSVPPSVFKDTKIPSHRNTYWVLHNGGTLSPPKKTTISPETDRLKSKKRKRKRKGNKKRKKQKKQKKQDTKEEAEEAEEAEAEAEAEDDEGEDEEPAYFRIYEYCKKHGISQSDYYHDH